MRRQNGTDWHISAMTQEAHAGTRATLERNKTTVSGTRRTPAAQRVSSGKSQLAKTGWTRFTPTKQSTRLA